MAETSTIMGLVAAFIGVAIMLTIGIEILGNVQNSTNCNSLPGYNSTGTAFTTLSSYTNNPDQKYSGWALSCQNSNSSVQNAYTLLIIILIVVAAVAILFVVRLL